MDEVCDYIKSACDIMPRVEGVNDSCYIEFKASEDIDWKDDLFIDYVRSELESHLGSDVSNISSVIEDNRISIKFTCNGLSGVISEWYNSRDYHYWVVSF